MRPGFHIKQLIVLAFWVMLGAGTVVLLVAAINKRNHKRCSGVDITISGVQNNYFIDKIEVKKILEKIEPGALGRSLHSFDLARLENTLEKNEWIKRAELFFDNNEILKINIIEREPVARIFTATGRSFYIDSALTRLSLAEKLSPRLPVFTNFPENKSLSKADIELLKGVRDIATYILNDPFWMAQIEQIDITSNRLFEMIPKVGNQVIEFGDVVNYKEKFSNLLLFYRSVLSKVGWSKYSKVNVHYKNQVIGVKRGTTDVLQDSIRSLQIMRDIIATALRQSGDSVNNIQLVQPQEEFSVPVAPDFGYGETNEEELSENTLQRDSSTSKPRILTSSHTNLKEQTKRTITENKKTSTASLKPVRKLKVVPQSKLIKPKPKAVMPSANEY